MNRERIIPLFILASFFCLIGMSTPASAENCDSEKSFGREDKTLFGRYCGLCHSMSGAWKRVGPPLKGLFATKQLVTGKPVTDDNVREIIMKGGPGLMPGYQAMLTPEQVNEIVGYLKETRCGATLVAK